MSLLQQELIAQAVSQLGVTEATSHNDGPAVESYLRSVSLGKGYPWCMAFVYWCAQQAAAKLGLQNPLRCTGSVLNQWNSGSGRHTQTPQPGCIFVMHHTFGYHTGIVTGIFPDGVLQTIEGNTNSNGSREGTSVLRKVRNHADLIGFILLEDKPAIKSA